MLHELVVAIKEELQMDHVWDRPDMIHLSRPEFLLRVAVLLELSYPPKDCVLMDNEEDSVAEMVLCFAPPMPCDIFDEYQMFVLPEISSLATLRAS